MEQFWKKVNKLNPDQCWDWKAQINERGYGKFPRAKLYGLSTRAHRSAWILTHGPIPNGLHVLHRCDNRRCCNPEHLFLGTPQDNTDDMIAKGRASHIRGEQVHISKLTEKKVIEIRESTISPKELAIKYGVTSTLIHGVQQGRTWKHVEGPLRESTRVSLTPQQIQEIVESKSPPRSICKKYGVTDNHIRYLRRQANKKNFTSGA